MELYEALPINLRSSYKEGISPIVRSQLEFLWRGAHAVSSSTALAHSLARKFMELSIKSGLHIPEQVRNRLCSWCSAVLLPTITSSVRIQSLGNESKVHKKKNLIPRGETNGDPDSSVVFDKKTRRKLKNQVVRSGIVCVQFPITFLALYIQSLTITLVVVLSLFHSKSSLSSQICLVMQSLESSTI